MIRYISKSIIFLALIFYIQVSNGQVTTVSGDYVHKVINSSSNATYTKSLILLHEIYDNTLLSDNYLIGTVAARRGGTGALNRLNVANVNTSSSYNATYANLVSNDEGAYSWKLKTCRYNGKKYLALDVPYSGAQHAGFQFVGWVKSSGVSLEFIPYDKNGVPQNTDILTEIADYVASRQISNYVSRFNVFGKVGIGTANPQADLSVNGNILATEIKVKSDISVPDYVFEPDYKLKSLEEIESYVKLNKHLPEIPSAKQIKADGMDLAGMNLLLLKKIEEMTLHLIEKDKVLKQVIERLEKSETVLSEMRSERKKN
ncbi:hypothetical protein [Sphingobacterium multivorum]|uniref:hypothetical protein n=1 Tax=Sphingobacterium multivorum TaxID=28454 RepID=UPI00345EBC97